MCRTCGVSRSGYYAFLKTEPSEKRDKEALRLISYYFEKSRRKAGIITLDLTMRRNGVFFNHKKIARIKRVYDLHTKIRRRNPYKGITSSAKTHETIPNILKRDFIHPLPDQVYSTDMTYLYYGNCEKAYLSATKDLATNEIVSFKLMRTPSVSNFIEEFKMLIGKMPKSKKTNLTIHSDQGFQYTHPEFVKLLAQAGVTQSMSRKGNCLDNAPIETFFGHFKDLLELKNCKTFEDVEKEVKTSMHYYNYERPQKGLNKKPPVEYRGLLNGFY